MTPTRAPPAGTVKSSKSFIAQTQPVDQPHPVDQPQAVDWQSQYQPGPCCAPTGAQHISHRGRQAAHQL